MHQSLRCFVVERVNRKKSVLEPFNTGLEETLNLVIQIEKHDTKKLSPSFFLQIVVVSTKLTPVKNMRIYDSVDLLRF